MIKKYYIWIYPFIVMGLVLILNNCCEKEEDSNTVTDINGNVYSTVTIGTQVWMVENLKTTKLNDGTSIPLVTDPSEWINLTTPAYCWYNNDENSYKNVYSELYNWHIVNTGWLCPAGWHVPTDAEWKTLMTYLGGEDIAGGKMKEAGTTHWEAPNIGATNESGFTAQPGGTLNEHGGFFNIGNGTIWWSSTFDTDFISWPCARDASVWGNRTEAIWDIDPVVCGFSVRCLKY